MFQLCYLSRMAGCNGASRNMYPFGGGLARGQELGGSQGSRLVQASFSSQEVVRAGRASLSSSAFSSAITAKEAVASWYVGATIVKTITAVKQIFHLWS